MFYKSIFSAGTERFRIFTRRHYDGAVSCSIAVYIVITRRGSFKLSPKPLVLNRLPGRIDFITPSRYENQQLIVTRGCIENLQRDHRRQFVSPCLATGNKRNIARREEAETMRGSSRQ